MDAATAGQAPLTKIAKTENRLPFHSLLDPFRTSRLTTSSSSPRSTSVAMTCLSLAIDWYAHTHSLFLIGLQARYKAMTPTTLCDNE